MRHANNFQAHVDHPRTKTSAPFSLRLSEAERDHLRALAGNRPLGAYIRSRIFDARTSPHRNRGKTPVADHKALAQLLGKLGNSRLSDSLNELAEAARMGTVPLDPETAASLQNACADIAGMKRMLMTALGIAER